MYIDSLTWSAIAVIFVTLLATIWVVHRSNREHRENIRRIAGSYAVILSSDDAIKLCKAIHKLHPDACPGLDYSLHVSNNGDANIAKWDYAQAAPTQEQLIDAIRTMEDDAT